jgi:hypothetical protein
MVYASQQRTGFPRMTSFQEISGSLQLSIKLGNPPVCDGNSEDEQVVRVKSAGQLTIMGKSSLTMMD